MLGEVLREVLVGWVGAGERAGKGEWKSSQRRVAAAEESGAVWSSGGEFGAVLIFFARRSLFGAAGNLNC